ncbi:MAG: biotin synthase BioB [Candidatus Omnitrophica bacterium]|nr:biotin synthase BioB [Candidatus Omnitrophota bacterium]
MKAFISNLKERIFTGGEILFNEAMKLAEIADEQSFHLLLETAHDITSRFCPKEPDLCSLINAKSYLCGEDCKFCAQSSKYQTGVHRYPLITVDEALGKAKLFEKEGVKTVCLVTSGGTLSEKEYEQVLRMIEAIKKETRMEVDGSLGFLSIEQVKRLRETGLRRINNNLQCSKEFYPEIVSTHRYEKRLETMDNLQEGGIEICSGGIFNLGESREDRIRMAFELKPFRPKCLPINILNPRPGTPLENQPRMDPKEILKTVAVYRFIHPTANIKLAGGREVNLSLEEQALALRGGANGLVVCGYLTTAGNPLEEDMVLLRQAGFDTARHPRACGHAGETQAIHHSIGLSTS